MGKKTKEECLAFIHRCLTDKVDNEWTKKKFIHQLGISVRTFQGYIAALRERGAKIKNRRGGGYYYLEPFNYKEPLIAPDDAAKLYAAVNILKSIDLSGQPFDIESVILKLEDASQIDAQIQERIVHFEHHAKLKGWKEYFDKLFNAIRDKKVLEVTYKRFYTDKAKTHIFHPWFLKEYHNRWYLFGRIEGKQAMTTLALDRIEALKPSGIAFNADTSIDATAYFRNAIGITFEKDAVPADVMIRVIKKQVPYFENQKLHDTQVPVKTYKNGDVLYRLQVIINIELKMLLLQYANTIKVLGPEALKAGFNEMLAAAVKLNLK